jgi:hypothetical protein
MTNYICRCLPRAEAETVLVTGDLSSLMFDGPYGYGIYPDATNFNDVDYVLLRLDIKPDVYVNELGWPAAAALPFPGDPLPDGAADADGRLVCIYNQAAITGVTELNAQTHII